ncbi:hypothetical protein HDU86_005278 [Geranomyces michiganensis]|nr:hypothetical protein HDU86_005278 [Geranomyces michiganensis]
MLSGLHEISHKIRTFVCLAFCSGPIMFIIGIIFVMSGSTDTRGDLITNYNRVVADWIGKNQAEFTSSGFAVAGMPLPMTNTPTSSAATLNDADAQGEVTPYAPWVAVADNVVPRVPTGPYTLTAVDGSGGSSVISLNIDSSQSTTTTKASMNCRVAGDCTGDSSSQDYKNCMAKATCTSTCSTLGGTLDSSGNCATVRYLDSVCVRVTHASGKWAGGSDISPNLGCYAETQFKLGKYTSKTLSLVLAKFEVRSAQDPMIYLSYRTGGTRYFGLKQSTKLAIGIVLLVLGIFVTLCVCGTVVVCLRRVAGLASVAAHGKVQQAPAPGVIVSSNPVGPLAAPYGPGMQQQQLHQQPQPMGYPPQQYAPAPYPPQQQPGPQTYQPQPYPQNQYPAPQQQQQQQQQQSYAPQQAPQGYVAPLQQQHQQIYAQPHVPYPQQPLPYNPNHVGGSSAQYGQHGSGSASHYAQPVPLQNVSGKEQMYQEQQSTMHPAPPPSYSAAASSASEPSGGTQQQYPPQQQQQHAYPQQPHQMPLPYNPYQG